MIKSINVFKPENCNASVIATVAEEDSYITVTCGQRQTTLPASTTDANLLGTLARISEQYNGLHQPTPDEKVRIAAVTHFIGASCIGCPNKTNDDSNV